MSLKIKSSDGANGSSSTSTSSSTPGAPSFGLGPNIVMGAFSMPVDVVGATQVILFKCDAGWLLFTMAHDGITCTGSILHVTLQYMYTVYVQLKNLLAVCHVLVLMLHLHLWCFVDHTCIRTVTGLFCFKK